MAGKLRSAGGLTEYDEYVPMIDKVVDAEWDKDESHQNLSNSRGLQFALLLAGFCVCFYCMEMPTEFIQLTSFCQKLIFVSELLGINRTFIESFQLNLFTSR